MKITSFLFFIGCFQLGARELLGQEKITINAKAATLESILKDIRKQTGYQYLFVDQWEQEAKKVDISVSNASLEEVLKICFKDQPFSYIIIKKIIVIRATEDTVKVRKASLPFTFIDIHGRVVDENNKPVFGVTVAVKGIKVMAVTDEDGEFILKTVDKNAVLVFSSVNMEPFEIKVDGKSDLKINLKSKIATLGDVTVEYSSGYQTISKEKATGSFDFIDNKLFNRSVSTDILSRIDGIASGVLFNTPGTTTGNDPLLSIRGRSTIYSNTSPLIILDNFPYNGDLNNINPNDVENVTVLKDAAAASIWGVRAGNGVIVITTKKGKYNQSIKLSFNTNLTVTNKPNLYYLPQLSSIEYIDVEKYLFKNGYYDYNISSGYQPISPVVDILYREASGQISAADANTQISQNESHDVRSDLIKYFYRPSTSQQYSLNLIGGSKNQKYFLAAGYDQNELTRKGFDYKRFTLNANNTYSLLRQKIQFIIGVFFTNSNTNGVSNLYNPQNPYESVITRDGNSASVVKDYSTSYIDTAGNGKFLNWTYHPLDENYSNQHTSLNQYLINAGITLNVIRPLILSLYYQYGNQTTNSNTLNDINSYYTRNIINQFTQGNGNNLTYPVPVGGIYDLANSVAKTKYFRSQLNYNATFSTEHEVTAVAGYELSDNNSLSNVNRLYGYDNTTGISIPVDYIDYFAINPSTSGVSSTIPYYTNQSGTVDRNISYYANAGYSYNSKYLINLSIRKDESNLFGVKANQKGVPLWSVGAGWSLSKESFYHFNVVPFLKLRASIGYNGNVNKNTSAFTTAQIQSSSIGIFGGPIYSIINPPNPSLTWEKVRILNWGLDFSTKKDILSGNIEYYIKTGLNLIGNSPIAPQSGVNQFQGNNANTRTKGMDIVINSNNLKGRFMWTTNILFSYTEDKILKYSGNSGFNSQYIGSNYVSPIKGKPYSSIFSYKWKGLDSSGNPQGILNKNISEDYTSIITSTNRNELIFGGAVSPRFFGSIRNNISYAGFEFSFLITYKAGSFFRKNSINYSSLFSGTLYQMSDFNKRWQQPGDEKQTNVPSMIYPDNSSRDAFYYGSEVTIEKGDQIRLQNIQLSFNLNNKPLYKSPFTSFKIYLFVNNLGVLWRANKDNIDPDFPNSIPTAKSLSFGIKSDLK